MTRRKTLLFLIRVLYYSHPKNRLYLDTSLELHRLFIFYKPATQTKFVLTDRHVM